MLACAATLPFALAAPIPVHYDLLSFTPTVHYTNHRLVRVQLDTKEQLDLLIRNEAALNIDHFIH